jgi:hypothetical protein
MFPLNVAGNSPAPPKYGRYNIKNEDVALVSRGTKDYQLGWKYRTVPHIPFGTIGVRDHSSASGGLGPIILSKKTQPSPSMTQYNIV